MKVTIKKFPEKKGLLGGTVFTLEMWLDLTKEEKAAIKSSGLTHVLLEIKNGANERFFGIELKNFMKNSGPKSFPFDTAFDAHAYGEEFKSNVETVNGLIKAYIAGDITREESFEL